MDELEKKGAEQTGVEELQKKLENLEGSLNYERSKRKELEKRLAAKAEDDAEDIKNAEAAIREKLKSGKSGLTDDVIEDVMNAFGKPQAEAQVRTAKQNIEKEIIELKRNPTYMDIEEYGDDIRKFMKKGLSAEQAYWAVAGAGKLSNSATKDKEESEKEESKKLNKERISEGYVDAKPAGADQKPTYTAKERANAEILGISPEEYKARSQTSFKIDDLIKLNKKFKKED